MRSRGARMWCSHCCEDIEVLSTSGWDSCSYCGKVLDCPVSKSLRMMGKLQKIQDLCGGDANLGNLSDGDDLQEKKHRHPADKKSSTSTKSLKRKSFNSDINYEILESLYEDNIKKQRTVTETAGECEKDEIKGIEETHKESEDSAVNNANDLLINEDSAVDNANDLLINEDSAVDNANDLIDIANDGDHYEDGNDDYFSNEDDDYYGSEEDYYYEKLSDAQEYYNGWDR